MRSPRIANGLRTLLLPILLVTVASSLSNFPIVRTSYGAVRGYEHRAENGFVSEIFKKIPYAAPPTGLRRWKKPEPPSPWNYTVDGTFFGPSCAQVPDALFKPDVTGFSEDCLTMNIYSSKQCRKSNASCPVVFYIHGGGEIFSGVPFHDETPTINFPAQGVIFVTFTYRLGPFGVLALGDENALPANLALHDVLECLRFVRREIHAFGGDKDQITLMGHSSAATMALAFVFSPAINKPGEQPLFARVIAISGTAVYESEEKQVDISHRLARKLGCDGTAREIIECLRILGTNDIIQATIEVSGTDDMSATQLGGITLAGELMPIRNSRELRDHQAYRREPKPTRLMIGTTLNEFGPGDGISKDGRVQALDVLGVRNVEECVEKYSRDVKSGSFDPGYDTTSQGLFLATALSAKAQSAAGGEVYVYQYDYAANAQHGADAYYIVGIASHPMDENEKWLSRVYPIYFTNFVKGLPPAPDWATHDPALLSYYSINKSFTDGIEPAMKLGYHRDLVNYYQEMADFDEQLTIVKIQLFNAPIEMRNITFDSSTEPFNLRDLLFYLAIICVVVFILFKLYHCYRDRSARTGELSRLIDQ